MTDSNSLIWGREEWLHLDTANSFSIDNSKPNVALVTPWDSPRVFYNPIVLGRGCISTISDNENSVIQSGSAMSWAHNTTWISLEDHMTCVNWNWTWLLGDSGFHACNIVSSYISVAWNINSSGTWCVVLAGSIQSCIWINWFKLSEVSLVVKESFVLPASIATIVDSWAINKLLFREG